MNKKINAFLAFLAMLILLAGAVMWGAYRGWSQERRQVESSMGTLYEMLGARREIGHNILTVAGRHLPETDAHIRALREDIEALSKDGDFDKLARANARFEKDAKELLDALKEQPTLKRDERDSMYATSMLPQALEQSARMTEQAEYNRQAADFNQSMDDRLSGRLARFLGVKKAQQFVWQEGER